MDLSCTHFPDFVNPTQGDLAYCTGGDDDAVFNGSLISRDKLPAYALREPLPTTDSCTVSSVVSPAWWLGDFATTKNTSTTGSLGSISLGIELQTGNEPTGYPAIIIHDGVQLAASGEPSWYPCDFAGIQPMAPSNCTFRYDVANKLLSLNTEWICNDLDVAHPYDRRPPLFA